MPLQRYEKEQILDACFVVFARYGYENTSTAMLAEAAGISKALIFHHFKNKKRLYLSVLGRCFEKMAPEMATSSLSEYKDYFEAREKSGFLKIDYLKKHPDVAKIMFEAFYNTPSKLKTDISNFKAYLGKKYGALHLAKEKKMKQLFEKVQLREGVNREQAFEFVGVIMDCFNKKYLAELTDENKLLDETYWQSFAEKKHSFIDMIRFGIEQERD